MSDAVTVAIRQNRGTRNARRQRATGSIPAVLYGHGQETISLSIPAEQVSAVVRHGARLIELKGAVTEKVFIRDMQWDTYGLHVLHLDLTRVSEDETVEVKVALELRGAAAGAKEGGVVEHLLHELKIECRVMQIPDKIQVKINELALGQEIKVADLPLPEGVRVLDDPDQVVVQCVQPREEVEPAAELGVAEPEVIGRKPEDEEGAEEE